MSRRALSASSPRSIGMDKYEQLSVVGEGSYGVVLKCRRRDNGKYVAIKKFLETEDDATIRKMALREIRMLKKLRHDNLVNLIEVFRRKRRFYLVFEYLDHTLLDEMESSPGGLGEETSKKHLYQLLRAIDYCHQNSIIHRDVKPENVLLSNNGIVKLCDLGFARALAAPGEPYTEYVSTRWYRAPELLVAEHRYGPEVDIWALGCLFAEMLTGEPLFPGDSDIDQLALIVRTVGKLAPRHQQVVSKLSGGAALTTAQSVQPRPVLPGTGHGRDLLAACLRTEPRARPSAAALLRHKYFLADGFVETFNAELRSKLGKELDMPSVPQQGSAAQLSDKHRQPWSVNIIPDANRSASESAGRDSLIDYKYTPNSESNIDSEKGSDKKNHICRQCPKCVDCQVKDDPHQRSLPPPTTRQQPQPLGKRLNDAFQSFPVPVNNVPRTSYIKKVNHKLVLDESILKGRAAPKKSTKKTSDVSLPYVPGASNSPMKRVKKPPGFSSKGYDTWEGARGPTSVKTPILPYM